LAFQSAESRTVAAGLRDKFRRVLGAFYASSGVRARNGILPHLVCQMQGCLFAVQPVLAFERSSLNAAAAASVGFAANGGLAPLEQQER